MIQAHTLTKRFGPTLAVNRVSFQIDRGQIVGFLGPNGAGKSTTLRMLAGYLPPTAGRAIVGGHDVTDQQIQARAAIGYLPESTPLYTEMRVGEYLHYHGRLYNMPRPERNRQIDRVLDRCGLTTARRRIIGHLSKGNRQRVGLAQALLHNPPVLILDEPAAGLDPYQITQFRAFLDELRQEHTIILSSHILPEIEKVADRVLILRAGELVADGSVDELRHQSNDHSLEGFYLDLFKKPSSHENAA